MRPAFILAAALAALLLPDAPARATSLGFELSIDGRGRIGPGSLNVPLFTLTNTSARAGIAGVEVTIGDTARSFDGVVGIVPPDGGGARLVRGDTGIDRMDGIATDVFEIAFSEFRPGARAGFAADIDGEDGSFHQDFRRVLFDNGDDVLNATITVRFDDPGLSVLSLTLPDIGAGWRYFDFAARMKEPLPVARAALASPLAAVPLPPALPALAGALAGLAWMGRRRRLSARGAPRR